MASAISMCFDAAFMKVAVLLAFKCSNAIFKSPQLTASASP